MHNMCPYNCYHCPYLPVRWMQTRQCMSKADLFTITQAANPDATYTIYFNPEFAATYDGVYKIYGSSGDYTYFVLFVQNLNGLNLQFNSDQICAIK